MISASRYRSIRERYDYRCGYCGVSETDTGGELTIDHYQPLKAGGTDDDDNLVYCCFRCNVFKGAYWQDSTGINRILHPVRDIASDHYFLDSRSGNLVPLTATGKVHIAVLQLNRTELLLHRLDKLRSELIKSEAESLRETLDAVLRLNETQTKIVHELTHMLPVKGRKRNRRS